MAANCKYTLHLEDFYGNNDISPVQKGKLVSERILKLSRRHPELTLNYDLIDYANGFKTLTGWLAEDLVLDAEKEFDIIMQDFMDYANSQSISIIT